MHEFHDSTPSSPSPLQGRNCFGADELSGLILSLIKQLPCWPPDPQQGSVHAAGILDFSRKQPDIPPVSPADVLSDSRYPFSASVCRCSFRLPGVRYRTDTACIMLILRIAMTCANAEGLAVNQMGYEMNGSRDFSRLKSLAWLMASLLVAFMAGCGSDYGVSATGRWASLLPMHRPAVLTR